MVTGLDFILGNDVITRYPWPVAPSQLMHVYSPQRTNSRGEQIPFDRITALLHGLRSDVEIQYERKTGQKMNTFALGERIDAIRQQFF